MKSCAFPWAPRLNITTKAINLVKQKLYNRTSCAAGDLCPMAKSVSGGARMLASGAFQLRQPHKFIVGHQLRVAKFDKAHEPIELVIYIYHCLNLWKIYELTDFTRHPKTGNILTPFFVVSTILFRTEYARWAKPWCEQVQFCLATWHK